MTIKEIAKEANVSVSTVSRYLNKGYVSEENKKIIKKIIKKYNYTQSDAAVKLRGKSNEIAVIIQRINSPTTSLFLEGVTQECIEQNIMPSFYPVNFNKELQDKYIKESISKKKKGILIYSFESEFNIDYKNIVVIGQKSRTHCHMYEDGKKIYYDMVNKILKERKNVKSVYFLGVELLDVEFINRLNGAKLAAKDNNVEFNLLNAELDKPIENLKLKKDSYYVCLTDGQAYSLLSKLIASKLTLGKDVLISGFGDYKTSNLLNLTTINIDYQKIGREAVKKIINNDYSNVEYFGKLIERKSTKQ